MFLLMEQDVILIAVWNLLLFMMLIQKFINFSGFIKIPVMESRV